MFHILRPRFSQLDDAFFQYVSPTPLNQGQLILLNHPLAKQLQLDQHANLLDYLTHGKEIAGYPSIATVYAGHQFGGYTPQLGDGRGLLIAEVLDTQNTLQEVHLKGSGPTPYSRQGDGRAVLRSSIREFLASEAMFHLNIPTTRALALCVSNTEVIRETAEPAATMTRVAESHIRFGHFEYFNNTGKLQGEQHGEKRALKTLIDFCIEHYYPSAKEAGDEKAQINSFYRKVCVNTAHLIAKWQSVGFCHGVMNTDNMSILGLTFDYGPFAFLDDYQPDYICNHSDTYGRYAFNQQPTMGQWNCSRLALSLKKWLTPEDINTGLKLYADEYAKEKNRLIRQKIGLATAQDGDNALINEWLKLLSENALDYHKTFRQLSENTNTLMGIEGMPQWLRQWQTRLAAEDASIEQAQHRMQGVNPIYTLRTYYIQQAIEAAHQDDYAPLNLLWQAIQDPFKRNIAFEQFEKEIPHSGKAMSLSCSS